MKRERTPLNAAGDFYVEGGTCLDCMAPHIEAPELMGHDDETGCHFERQPASREEVRHAVEAVGHSCVAALRYAGTNPLILARLLVKGCKSQCDALNRNDG